MIYGCFHDPLVGRDLLIGAFLGCASAFIMQAPHSWPAVADPFIPISTQFGGLRQALGFFSNNLSQGVIESLGGLFFLVLFRILVRKQWIAMVLLTVLIAFVLGGWEVGWVLANLILAGIRVFAMVRFGLLATAVTATVLFLLINFPVAIHWSDWYVAEPVFLWCFVAAVALYGFRTALGKMAFSAVLRG